MMRPWLAMALAALLTGCATAPAPSTPQPALAAAPVFDADFPDPAVLRAPDGYYYAYATQGMHDGRMHNIPVARSSDLTRWELAGDALPVKPGWAAATQDFWAPHVHHHGGRYYLYYSAKPDAALTDTSRGLCLAVAVADRPTGPFTDIGQPLQCGDGFINIDPMAFDDPATGKPLLYWGSGFGAIKVQELSPDRISFAPGSRPVDLIAVEPTDRPDNYERLIEGVWIHPRDGWYYLFYSGDNCCGERAHYATLVARSRSATGPFETRGGARGAAHQPIIAADSRWLAPGHNSVIADETGRTWTLYHAIDRNRPRTRPEDGVNTRRVMLLGELVWEDGWPRLAR
jgi:arabinan endo-1,5-alpha-L-arabinosidase